MAGTRPDRSLIKVAERTRADIALLQVLPGNTLAGLETLTADMAIASGCRIVVPQHHDQLLEGAKQTDLTELKRLLAASRSVAMMIGSGLDPADQEKWAILEEINHCIVKQAVELGGTCTGEHGIGIGKRKFMELEHGQGQGC